MLSNLTLYDLAINLKLIYDWQGRKLQDWAHCPLAPCIFKMHHLSGLIFVERAIYSSTILNILDQEMEMRPTYGSILSYLQGTGIQQLQVLTSKGVWSPQSLLQRLMARMRFVGRSRYPGLIGLDSSKKWMEKSVNWLGIGRPPKSKLCWTPCQRDCTKLRRVPVCTGGQWSYILWGLETYNLQQESQCDQRCPFVVIRRDPKSQKEKNEVEVNRTLIQSEPSALRGSQRADRGPSVHFAHASSSNREAILPNLSVAQRWCPETKHQFSTPQREA